MRDLDGVARTLQRAVLLCVTFALARAAPAQEQPLDLRAAVERAAQQNPQVVAAWRSFLASRDERTGARGAYLPRIDIEAQSGREESRTPLRAEDRYGVRTVRLSLTQMIFDGFATQSEVARLGATSRVRFHELEESGENVGLDAVTAYLDVVRRQSLVEMARENAAFHREIFEDIGERSRAGVSRRADLEQASGRLALAETNLLIELANLHDVTARFQRVIGALPSGELPSPELPVEQIPRDVVSALRAAYAHHPRLSAARSSIRAARAERNARTAAFSPRLDLRLTQQRSEDVDGIEGSHDETRAELVLSYNLFRGGSDWYRRRQFDHRLGAARELRDQACRDVRQTLLIAFNDRSSLLEQVVLLERNELSIAKARISYRAQFRIGQRSLLDLLDTENEYFEIRRRRASTEVDLEIAQARTLAAMGLLLDALGIAHRGTVAPPPLAEGPGASAASDCPLEVPLPGPEVLDALPPGTATN